MTQQPNDILSDNLIITLKNELVHVKNQRIALDKDIAANEARASAMNDAIDMVHRILERQKVQ